MIRIGNAQVSLERREAFLDGKPILLGGRAFEVLATLIKAKGRVVGKDELFSQVWAGTVVEDNNLQVQVSLLRKAFGDRGLIQTVPRRVTAWLRRSASRSLAWRWASHRCALWPIPPNRSTTLRACQCWWWMTTLRYARHSVACWVRGIFRTGCSPAPKRCSTLAWKAPAPACCWICIWPKPPALRFRLRCAGWRSLADRVHDRLRHHSHDGPGHARRGRRVPDQALRRRPVAGAAGFGTRTRRDRGRKWQHARQVEEKYQHLTQRERQVFSLVVGGLSHKQIARKSAPVK